MRSPARQHPRPGCRHRQSPQLRELPHRARHRLGAVLARGIPGRDVLPDAADRRQQPDHAAVAGTSRAGRRRGLERAAHLRRRGAEARASVGDARARAHVQPGSSRGRAVQPHLRATAAARTEQGTPRVRQCQRSPNSCRARSRRRARVRRSVRLRRHGGLQPPAVPAPRARLRARREGAQGGNRGLPRCGAAVQRSDDRRGRRHRAAAGRAGGDAAEEHRAAIPRRRVHRRADGKNDIQSRRVVVTVFPRDP